VRQRRRASSRALRLVPKRLQRLGNRLRNERGFTLIETLVAMSILSTVLGGITVLSTSGIHSQADLTARFQAQTDLHIALDKLRKDVHAACSQTAQSGTSVTLDDPPCDGTKLVTWCTVANGSQYDLYRVTGSACTGGVKWAAALTGSSVFSYLGPNSPAGSYALARLHVDMILNARPSNAAGRYHVVDDLVFRNSPRCIAGTNCP
jgi:prepilin-type N-terminal cleavage/methylation domain-containing protein